MAPRHLGARVPGDFQAQAGPVTVPGLETILARAAVAILAQLEDKPPELVAALLPSLVRIRRVSAGSLKR